MPNLDPDLQVNSVHECKDLDSKLLVSFIKKNHIALDVLHLSANNFDEHELIKSLGCMHGLRELRVRFREAELVSDTLLRALSRRSRTPTVDANGLVFVDACFVCPVLTTFTLTVDVEEHNISDDAATELARSRQNVSEYGSHKSAWEELALPILTEKAALLSETVSVNLSSTLASE